MEKPSRENVLKGVYPVSEISGRGSFNWGCVLEEMSVGELSSHGNALNSFLLLLLSFTCFLNYRFYLPSLRL